MSNVHDTLDHSHGLDSAGTRPLDDAGPTAGDDDREWQEFLALALRGPAEPAGAVGWRHAPALLSY